MSDTLTTALEKSAQPKEAQTILQLIERQKPEIEKLVGATIGAERFARTVLTELRRTPKLYDCTPESVLGAMMLAAQLELEPGPLGHVYLVPFKRDCTFVLGYKGMVALAYRSGMVKRLATGTVREGDRFEYEYGTTAKLRHTPTGPPGERSPEAFYAVAETTTGGKPFVVLYPEEIEATRKRSPNGKSPYSPWTTDYDAMARKTAVRRLAPMLPQSPVFARALEADSETIDVEALSDDVAASEGDGNP